MVETFKPIKGYEGLYEVSNLGRVLSLPKRVDRGKCHRNYTERIKALGADTKGYLRVSLSKEGVNKTHKVHRLVAEAFIDNPNNLPQVNHIDGNKSNNCVDNLEWCTHSENQLHAYKTGLNSNAGEHNPAHKLTEQDVKYIRANYKRRDKINGVKALAKKFNVDRHTITRIVNGTHWKEVV